MFYGLAKLAVAGFFGFRRLSGLRISSAKRAFSIRGLLHIMAVSTEEKRRDSHDPTVNRVIQNPPKPQLSQRNPDRFRSDAQ